MWLVVLMMRQVVHKLLFTDRPVLKIRKTFANNSSANIIKTQLSKVAQLGLFIGPLQVDIESGKLTPENQ